MDLSSRFGDYASDVSYSRPVCCVTKSLHPVIQQEVNLVNCDAADRVGEGFQTSNARLVLEGAPCPFLAWSRSPCSLASAPADLYSGTYQTLDQLA